MSSPSKRALAARNEHTHSEGAATDIQLMATRGARTQRDKYFRDINAFALPVALVVVVQAALYLSFVLRGGMQDWQAIGQVVGVISLVPVVAAFTLTAFRRHEAPITVAALVTTIIATFAVAFLSALRVRMSYTGLSVALPASVLVMAYANLRFHQAVSDRVGVLRFPHAARVRALLGGTVPLIWRPEESITHLDTVLIDPAEHHSQRWSNLLMRCHMGGVQTVPWTRFIEIRLGRVDIGSFDVSHIAYSPSQVLYWRVKRFLDITAVLVTLPLTLPLAALVAAYIRLRDGGPVLFVQTRRGYGGCPFRMLKFRTMREGASGGATAHGDKRIIPGGRLIRRLRLDELPQLLNVLRGEMSLIGPRPEAIDLASWYDQEIPEYVHRLLILPGITGWAQVNNGYTANPDEARIKLSYDLYYIKHLSFDLDLLILFKTLRTLLLGSGAR